MTWTRFIPGKPPLIEKVWYMNTRSFVDGGHDSAQFEVETGDVSKVEIPEDCYSFRLFVVAKTEIEIPSSNGEKLLLRSDPLFTSPVYFIRERVSVMSCAELRETFSEEEIGALVNRMELLNIPVCMVLPGNVFMPITDDVNFLELAPQK